jgi:hypothetical protein
VISATRSAFALAITMLVCWVTMSGAVCGVDWSATRLVWRASLNLLPPTHTDDFGGTNGVIVLSVCRRLLSRREMMFPPPAPPH